MTKKNSDKLFHKLLLKFKSFKERVLKNSNKETNKEITMSEIRTETKKGAIRDKYIPRTVRGEIRRRYF